MQVNVAEVLAHYALKVFALETENAELRAALAARQPTEAPTSEPVTPEETS